MTSTTVRKALRRLWPSALWLALWQAGAMALHQPLLLPSPLAAAGTLLSLAGTAAFWGAVVRSAGRLLAGFALGSLAGALLAAAASVSRPLRAFLAPAVSVLKAVPVASFILLALVWVSARNLSVCIAFVVVFPTVYLTLLEGIAAVDGELLEMARVFRVPLGRKLAGIYLPALLPAIRSACALGMGLCWKAGVAAEIIGVCAGTIGEGLYNAKIYFETAELFAWTAAVVLLSVLAERAVLALLDALAGRKGDAS